MTWPEGAPSKAELRKRLRRAYPWLDDERFGPRNVEAGDCDRCGAEPRLVQTCGPTGYTALGRRCADETGEEAWCDGHRQEAADARTYLGRLPDEADDVARLWWLATGEVRLPRQESEGPLTPGSLLLPE